MDNQLYKVKISRSSDRDLQKYSILSIRSQTDIMHLVIRSKDSALLPEEETTKREWMMAFMKFNQTTQKVGIAVKEAIQAIEQQALFLNQEKTKIKDKEIQVKASKKADTLVAEFRKKEVNLEKEMEHCGLSTSDIGAIKQYSAGVYDITNFFDRLALLNLPKNTTIIGLNYKEIIPAVKETLGCEDYMDAYERLFNNFKARDDFLEKLTTETHPIIFLVPHKLFGPRRGVTAGEMEWLLKHPESMARVHFVFRSYKVYSLKEISSTGLREKDAESYQEHLTVRIFQQIQAKFTLPKMKFNASVAMSEWFKQRWSFEQLKLQPYGKDADFAEVSLEGLEFPLIPFTEPTPLSAMVSPSQAISLSRETIKALKASRAIFLIGGAGSGKGTVRDLIEKEHPQKHYTIIDPDRIKESMVGYQTAIGLGIESATSDVHEQSVKAATELLAYTISQKQSFIYDSTGSRFWIYEEQMEAAINGGMFVELIYVETAVESCLKRTEKRGKLSGRIVPEAVVRSSNQMAKDTFLDLQSLAHRVKKYNNDGAQPQLVSVSKHYA